MNRERKILLNVVILVIALCMAGVVWSAPMGTAFTYQGRLTDANSPAEVALDTVAGETPRNAEQLVPELARLGARFAPLRVGDLKVGDAVYLPDAGEKVETLAERERDAILQTLEGHGWRLAQSARALGISRTTLWRRLKEYGLRRGGRGKWSQPS